MLCVVPNKDQIQVSVALKFFLNCEFRLCKRAYELKIEWVRYALSLVREGGIAVCTSPARDAAVNGT